MDPKSKLAMIVCKLLTSKGGERDVTGGFHWVLPYSKADINVRPRWITESC